ncbi:hypothetical protein LN042_10845 [Kitasatospora sp. RB6PN24]|uniref:hypothetical protein n=1 Tax=Kitasatospora humi TaxID=2893891 RepID=UPI001E628008|nr:hypothetical protein [Kitasatospora humi]MCC9307593.1 hypothetical protein [Kitasatospora humi]
MAVDYPTAAPGFGKRTAPSQHARSANDFAHLPEREAYLAHFIDRLPEGAAIDIKTLAREQPRYGQQAVGKALKALCEAGHLKREREKVGDGVVRWVWRTFFSRTPRTESWWHNFLGSRRERRASADADPEPGPPPRSEAYRALAELGGADKRLMLSAKDCEALEPLAAEWFARRVTLDRFLHVMTNDLPHSVSAPGPFVRRRLVDKIPPEPPAAPTAVPRCADCRAPVPRAGALCRRCRTALPDLPHPGVAQPDVAQPPGVRDRMIAEVRAVVSRARERGGRERGGRERRARERGDRTGGAWESADRAPSADVGSVLAAPQADPPPQGTAAVDPEVLGDGWPRNKSFGAGR